MKKRDILLKEIAELEDKKILLNIKITRLNEELSTYNRFIHTPVFSTKLIKNVTYVNKVIPVSVAQKRLEDIIDPIKNIEIELIALQKNERDLTKQISNINEELNSLNLTDPLNLSSKKKELKVIIKIAAREPSDFSLDLSYIIPGASWRSLYHIRVDSKDNGCILVYQGIIRNSTGENWDNVNVTLSTAEPSKGGEPPKIPTLIINIQDNKPVTYIYQDLPVWGMDKKREVSQVKYESFSESDDEDDSDGSMNDKKKPQFFKEKERKEMRDDEEEASPIMERDRERGKQKESNKKGGEKHKRKYKSGNSGTEEDFSGEEQMIIPSMESKKEEEISVNNSQQVDVNQSVVCATFTISRPCTIQSDTKPHKVTIAIIPLEATFEYEVVPSMSLSAYLKALTKNTSPYTLLAGRMSIFINNFFVTSTALKLTSPGEDMELFLGVDSSVKVEYTKTPHQQGRKGIKKNKTRTVSHITNIKNNKPEIVTITVLEQFPTTNDSKVKITLLQPDDPEKYSITERNNLVKWVFDLEPMEEIKLPFSYVIEYPNNRIIDVNQKPL